MRAIYDAGLEHKIDKVFDSDVEKLGARAMGKNVNYLNSNTFLRNDEILICTEKHIKEVYEQLRKHGIQPERIYKLTDSIFARDI